jgi:ornithine--oxo-acid transaminase
MMDGLRSLGSPLVGEIRGRGLFIGMELHREMAAAADVCRRLMARGILTKETNRNVVRFAPPLVITREEIDWAVDRIGQSLDDMAGAEAPALEPA